MPRQAGKSHDAIIWAAFLVLEMGYSVLWTDHNYSTTCEMLARFRKIFGKRVGDPDAHRAINRRVSDAKSKTAQESYEFANGGVLCFSTRTDSASLGYSFDVIIYDEAQLLTKSQAQTLNPTTTHAPHKNSQLVYVGTPKGYVIRPTTDQAITAANLIFEAAGDGGITHIECPALDLSAATATRREIGKGGGWGFGGDNSTPIEAAGLALLGLATSKRNPKRKARVT